MEIVMSWDSECGCPVEIMKRRTAETQSKYDPHCSGGYFQVVTSARTLIMVFSTEWISMEVAENFVVEKLKAALKDVELDPHCGYRDYEF